MPFTPIEKSNGKTCYNFLNKFIQAQFAKDSIIDSWSLHNRKKTCEISHLKLYHHNKLVTKFYSDVNIDNLKAAKSKSKKYGCNINVISCKKQEKCLCKICHKLSARPMFTTA